MSPSTLGESLQFKRIISESDVDNERGGYIAL